jgi:hypothetical protein
LQPYQFFAAADPLLSPAVSRLQRHFTAPFPFWQVAENAGSTFQSCKITMRNTGIPIVVLIVITGRPLYFRQS